MYKRTLMHRSMNGFRIMRRICVQMCQLCFHLHTYNTYVGLEFIAYYNTGVFNLIKTQPINVNVYIFNLLTAYPSITFTSFPLFG